VIALPLLVQLAQSLYRPPITLLVVGLAIAIALTSLFIAARREHTRWTVLLRVVAIAGVAWVLMGHSRTEPHGPSTAAPPKLTMLVDTSASMAELDAAASTNSPPRSRLQAVIDRYLSAERMNALREHADVELIAFDNQIRPYHPSIQAQGPATELLGAIAQTRADATLILSDGHDTSRRAKQPADLSAAGRLFAVPVGAPRSAPDLALQAWPDSDRLFEDQRTTITATLQQRGFEGRDAIVELLFNGEAIDTRPITLGELSEIHRFEVSPPLAPGQTVQANHYTVQVRLTEGEEAYPDNNVQDLFIQTSRGRIKVLLIEGEPYWDTRSLARLIAGHPRFDLTALYSFGDQRRSRVLGESIDPATDPAMQLEAFDIVILGRQAQRLTDPGFGDRLSAFVRKGGAAVFARGQPFDANDAKGRALLQSTDGISPVNWGEPVVGEMRVRLGQSADARGPLADLRDDEVLSRLPGMLAATRIDGRKTASLVMLEQQQGDGPAMAALTSLRVGSGVSMAVLTEGLWRWELLPDAGNETETQSIYGVFWIRALQWLASGGAFLPGQDIAIEADRLSVEPGETVTLNISTRYIETAGLNLQLKAIDAEGNAQPLQTTPGSTPGTYTTAFTPEQTGVYRFSLTTPGRNDLIEPDEPLTTHVASIDRSPERRDTSAQPDRLKQLVESTGGVCLTLDNPDPLIDYLQTLQALRGSEDRVDYAFNNWPIFALIAGCFGLEWICRRLGGLR